MRPLRRAQLRHLSPRSVRDLASRAAGSTRAALRCPSSRRALLRRALAASAAIAVGGAAASALDAAGRLRDRWDATTTVVVARRDLAAGDRVPSGALALQRRPAALVPTGALDAVPRGRRIAVVDVPAGEAVLPARLAAPDEGRVIPSGRVALAVAPVGPVPPASAGDRVDVLAVVPNDPFAPPPATSSAPAEPGAPVARVVASGAVVVEPASSGRGSGAEPSLTVAVDESDAAATAAAILAGPVTVAIRGP